jgi:hypothetical protein
VRGMPPVISGEIQSVRPPRIRFSLWHIMAATGVLGVLLGFLLRDPHTLMPVAHLVILLAVPAITYLAIRVFVRLPPRSRIAVEISALVVLVTMSAVIWRPGFYTSEEQRCEELALLASRATGYSPEMRVALDREAAWFSRKAASLRWRGLWLGLTMGPATGDHLKMSRLDDPYQFGVLESIEKHEKSVKRYSSPIPPSP